MNPAPTPFEHAAQTRAGQHHHALGVHSHHARLALHVHGLEATCRTETGVVDQVVDLDAALLQLACQLKRTIGLRQVLHDDLHVDAVDPCQIGCQLLEFFARARG